MLKIDPCLAAALSSTAVPFSDDDLALKFAAKHGDELRHVADWGQWLIWDGTLWQRDDRLQVYSMARDLLREECDTLPEKEQVKGLNSAGKVHSVVSLARCDQQLAAVIPQWDVHTMLLNTPGGIIDLTTGRMLGEDIIRLEYYMTKVTACTPANTGCPRFMEFLKEITDSNDDLIGFLQRMLGYSLTGSTREHALFFLYGTGANGKSVLINLVAYILGEYHRSAPMETFTVSNSDRHPTELAMLQGRRLVTSVETEEGRAWAESKVKQLTGGDKINARYMRQDFFEYVPQFKLLIAGNHKPQLRSVDEATKRRFNLVPFNVTIPKGKRDPELLEKLKAEAAGILKWMIDGALAWQEQGLNPPAIVTEATQAYLQSEDVLSGWIEDCCVLGPNKFEPAGALFASWRKWAKAAGEEKSIPSQKAFGRALDSRGIHPLPRTAGVRSRGGIELTEEARSEASESVRHWND
jgi:putative DNA primase/helicase